MSTPVSLTVSMALAAAPALLPAAAADHPVAQHGTSIPAGLPWSTAPAEDGQPVQVLLDQVEPAVAQVGEPVTLRGRVLNRTEDDQPVSRVSAAAAWGPLVGRAEVSDWVDGDLERDTPWPLGDVEIGPRLGAGREIPFEITLGPEVLEDLPGALVPLAVRLEVTQEIPVEDPDDHGDDDGDGDAEDGDEDAEGTDDEDAEPQEPPPPPEVVHVTSMRTVLTATRAQSTPLPLQTAWVVPLTLPGTVELVSTDEAVRVQAWYDALGPSSAISSWLTGLGLQDVTYVVDPALLAMLNPAPELVHAPPDPDPTEPDPTEPDPTEPDPTEPDPTEPEPTEPEPTEPDQTTPSSPAQTGPEATTSPGATTGTQDPTGQSDSDAATPTAGTTGPPTTPGDDSDTTASPTGTPFPVPPPEDEPASEESDPQQVELEEVHHAQAVLASQLSQLDEEHLWWLPTDDPDLATLLTLRMEDAWVADLLRRTPQDLDTAAARLLSRGHNDVAWPVFDAPGIDDISGLNALWQLRSGGVTSDDAAGAASTSDLRAVILHRESLTAASGAPVSSAAQPVTVAEGAEPIVAVGADSRVGSLLADAAREAGETGDGAVAQRLLADSLAMYLQDPAAARTVVIAPPRDVAVPTGVLTEVSSGMDAAPWVSVVSASDVIDAGRGQPPARLSGTAPQADVLGEHRAAYLSSPAHPVDSGRAHSLARIDSDVSGLAEVLTDTDSLQSWRPVLAGMWSTRWRADPDGWVPTWRMLRDQTRDARQAVYVNPSTVNFLADRGMVQITVINDLPVPVHDLHVELVPDNGRLQIVDQPAPVSVGAGARATVTFTARAVTRGDTTVTAYLTTPSGTELGDDAQVAVRVQPTGQWIYWVLGGLAALLLAAGLFRALRVAPRAAASTSTPDKEHGS